MALVLLVIVLIPHVGKGVNGARRWIPLGIMNLQPSELMKLAVRSTRRTTRCASRVDAELREGLLADGVRGGLVGALLLLEPDMGAFMVIAAIAMGVLFLGGVNGKLFGGLVATAIGTFTMLVAVAVASRADLRVSRSVGRTLRAGQGYQLTHSLIAFGRGEWFGVGLGGSVEKLTTCPKRTPTSSSR
jgi:cell division protein FtsW